MAHFSSRVNFAFDPLAKLSYRHGLCLVARFSQRHQFSRSQYVRPYAVIVETDKYDVWLDADVTDFDAIRDILKPSDAAQCGAIPVSTKPQ